VLCEGGSDMLYRRSQLAAGSTVMGPSGTSCRSPTCSGRQGSACQHCARRLKKVVQPHLCLLCVQKFRCTL
jgi:hypothetical protein